MQVPSSNFLLSSNVQKITLDSVVDLNRKVNILHDGDVENSIERILFSHLHLLRTSLTGHLPGSHKLRSKDYK
jgi:hypothetical protein